MAVARRACIQLAVLLLCGMLSPGIKPQSTSESHPASTARLVANAERNPSLVAGIPANYDENKVGHYTLPDPLVLRNGSRVRDAQTWLKKRRPEMIGLYEENQFGRAPGRPAQMSFDVFDKGTPAFNGKALRRQITIHFRSHKDPQEVPKLDLALYLPTNASGKRVPVLLYISFSPNEKTVDDPSLKRGVIFDPALKKRVAATPSSPSFSHLDVIPLLEAGFGVATFNYADVEPDSPAGLPFGVRAMYFRTGQITPAANEWGAIGAWAWGMSRAMDYLVTDAGVDPNRVAIMGISRLGKTALWAGAKDTRFAAVIASCSG